MSEQWQRSPLAGVLVFTPKVFTDQRGDFAKTFHQGLFAQAGVQFEMREEFFSRSAKNVIRGMHFQVSPHDHAKLVTCLQGSVLDVVVDLRKGQPTFGQAWAAEISAENRHVIYIPSGLAHGFLSLKDGSLTHYKTTATHSPAHDKGICWDSFGFKWPISKPVLSERDAGFPALKDFQSPFA